eukprot:COSAG01_NODE_1503_length_10093_cov_8.276010_12_plen_125_part_00
MSMQTGHNDEHTRAAAQDQTVVGAVPADAAASSLAVAEMVEKGSLLPMVDTTAVAEEGVPPSFPFRTGERAATAAVPARRTVQAYISGVNNAQRHTKDIGLSSNKWRSHARANAFFHNLFVAAT